MQLMIGKVMIIYVLLLLDKYLRLMIKNIKTIAMTQLGFFFTQGEMFYDTDDGHRNDNELITGKFVDHKSDLSWSILGGNRKFSCKL